MGSAKWSLLLARINLGCIIFSCLGFAAQTFLHADPGIIAPIMSAVIMVSGAACIAISLRDWRAIVGVLVIGSGAELIGLFTGLPFGVYEYTKAWIPTVPVGSHQFPLLLPLAWLTIVGGCWIFARQFAEGWRLYAGTATLAALIDLPMERAMTEVFGYWKWLPPGPIFGAPLLNVIGWLLVGFLAAVVLGKFDHEEPEIRPAFWILPAFCCFTAFCGVVTLPFDPAWPVLIGIAALLHFLRPKYKNFHIIGD